MSKGIVLSLYDFTGEALKPWAEAGYECYAFDIQHEGKGMNGRGWARSEHFDSGGKIRYWHMDLWNLDNIKQLRKSFKNDNVVFGMAFPVCTD